jgi:dolichol-phosphate mannosyltransferase
LTLNEPANCVEPVSPDGPPLVSLVIPTRNEAVTAPILVNQLSEVLTGLRSEVIFVDDSDDDTRDLIESAAREAQLSVSVIHREKKARQGGLSTAVLEGMRAADGRYVLIMDADLQHPPTMIPSLVEAARASDADIVIASRNIPGGVDAGLDGVSRKLISWGAKWLVKLLFPDRLRAVSDPLSGFFLARRDLALDASLRPVGFKILLDILIRCPHTGIREVPLRFAARAGGRSKATFTQGKTFLAHVLTLLWDTRFRGEVRRRPARDRPEP